ncbi:sugar phosphate isomerase/epimerase family protein [Coraliomargarita algicola]|uniref:Sugar phosphate isomerase/epimerase family protein n=1 Tax=Coraliomargarita algicola TaxID=3092156 RepID=A0ABZ0RL66_9BACT|nr:sugar phosphate isomerase/epimerase family protein [Coraliomargarita sp. J2-16]WPJ96956.1 sugar phosphate isomerase/epimerase family protein [Coraliomargarita sp. J2-16]
MLYSGLCSISFRQLSIDALIDLCVKAKIDGIEWGGDVHVPPGDIELAQSVRTKTEAAGLKLCSYGSYYRCDTESGSFSDVLDTADALGTPVIRVWAGPKASADASPDDREEVAEHLRRAVIAAREMNITIALEYHGGTLTDTQASAHQLLDEVNLPDLKLYWQPRAGGKFAEDLLELQAALPHLSHVHCFHWGPAGWQDRRALLDGTKEWQAYLAPIRQLEEDRYVILEFAKDDSTEQFLEDAQVLRSLLNNN